MNIKCDKSDRVPNSNCILTTVEQKLSKTTTAATTTAISTTKTATQQQQDLHVQQQPISNLLASTLWKRYSYHFVMGQKLYTSQEIHPHN